MRQKVFYLQQLYMVIVFMHLFSLTLQFVPISQLALIQSGIVVLHNSNTTVVDKVQNTFSITYTKSHSLSPVPFYFLNRYKMNDRFIYENLITQVSSTAVDKWTILYHPISTTNVLALSISYIAVENVYSNFYVKEYTYANEANLTSGAGARSYVTSPYNFNTQTEGTLNTTFSQNKIIVSLTGFYHVTSKDVDLSLNAYFMNVTHYQVYMGTTVSDYWYRINLQVCMINLGKFPASVKVLMGTDVLSVSNNIKVFYQFNTFANVSYCFGYSGLNANTSDPLDIFWKQFDSTAIEVSLSLMTFGRYSHLAIWNQTIPVAPVDPTPTPINPVPPTPIAQMPSSDSSSTIGIIIGVVIGLITIAGLSFLLYKFYFNRGTRVPIKQSEKQYNVFTPSFN